MELLRKKNSWPQEMCVASLLAGIRSTWPDHVKAVEPHETPAGTSYLAVAISAATSAPPPTAKASSKSPTAKSGMSRLRLFRTWEPPRAPAIAPSPPRSAPAASGRFTAPQTAAPQIAPDAMREASGPALNRLGVKDSLSAINSLIARSVIVLEALAEIIVANGELPR